MPEARVLQQLVEALLFEGVATWLRPQQQGPSRTNREFAFQLARSSYVCCGQVGAFGRVRISAGSVRKLGPRKASSASWKEVLADVPGVAPVEAAIAEELENTVRLCRWNAHSLPELGRSRRGLDYEQLEHLLHEGHPYHPCFKSRTGFSVEDHAAYGPEAGRPFELRWLGVHRSVLRQTLPATESDLFSAELGPRGWSALSRELERAGAPLDQYGLLPVHPWQWRWLEQSPALTGALARRELIALDAAAGRFRATQSLRTLLPVDRPGGAHLKLPMAVRVSSSLRTLQPETVHAAPAVSGWLQKLVTADPFFEEVADAVVLAERASAAYAPNVAEAAALESNLSAIWRDPIARHLRPGESALPFNALFAIEPDERPHIEPWLASYGLVPWLQRLLHVSLMPLWRLLVHHGIALEAHAQNLILVHRDGLPARVALRDFHDSLEYVPSFLARPDLVPDFSLLDPRFAGAPRGRYYAMSSERELFELFADTVLIFNLTELSWMLERHCSFPESDFWRLARAVLAEYRCSRWHEPLREARLPARAPLLRSESLFKTRLRAASEKLLQHVVPNALREPTERGIHVGYQ
ncbi:MAG TPA: IucA/IucC family protein [Polyangiaceae bacterium]|nr:IucA/IucC family protein [Polyangiaceae bacterium]